MAGMLEASEAAGEVSDEVVLPQRGAGSQDHGRGHLLAEAVVGHAEHRHLRHLVEFVQGGLHLGAVDVLAAADHHVLGSILDVNPPVGVDLCDVTGAEPAVDDRLGGASGLLR